MLIFVVAKLYLIIPATIALSSPRTGDDALVYLWKGQLSFKKNPSELKSLQDIQTQAQLPNGDNEKIEIIRSNIVGRILGNTTPTYNILSFLAEKISPNLRWAYAITELIGLALMTFGIGWFFLEVAGPAVAGLAMIPLAFAILPGQGISSFIPSNISLSSFLILWAYLWQKKEKINTNFVGIYVLLILSLHPIAKVYLAITPALYWIRLKKLDGMFSKPMLRLVASLCIPLIITIFFIKKFPILDAVPLGLKGSLNFSEGLAYNLLPAFNQINRLFFTHNILWVFLISSGLLLSAKKILVYPVNYFLIGITGLLFMSLCFVLPGYPSELFNRIWVLLFMIGSLIGGRFLCASQNSLINWAKYTISIVLFILSVSYWIIKYVPDSLNNRPEIIIETKLKKNISEIPLGNTIIYPETLITLQASLLYGGDKLGILALPMVEDPKELTKLINEKKPKIIMMPPDINLNSLYRAKAKKFIGRRQGLHFSYVKEFEIYRMDENYLNKVFLQFKNVEPKKISICWEALEKNGRIISRNNQALTNEILELNLPEKTEILRVIVPEIPFWLIGIRGKSSDELKIKWPWNEGLQLRYKLRYKNKPAIVVDFNPLNSLKNLNAKSLNAYVKRENPVISDDSGFVFLKTTFDQELQKIDK